MSIPYNYIQKRTNAIVPKTTNDKYVYVPILLSISCIAPRYGHFFVMNDDTFAKNPITKPIILSLALSILVCKDMHSLVCDPVHKHEKLGFLQIDLKHSPHIHPIPCRYSGSYKPLTRLHPYVLYDSI